LVVLGRAQPKTSQVVHGQIHAVGILEPEASIADLAGHVEASETELDQAEIDAQLHAFGIRRRPLKLVLGQRVEAALRRRRRDRPDVSGDSANALAGASRTAAGMARQTMRFEIMA
jgi:hypothetical protein